MKKKTIVTALIGNIFEYYDFTIYAVFSIQIGQTFFASSDTTSQILLSLGVYAVGNVSRAFGGAIFGHISDKKGRKASLTIAMIGMAISTLLISFIPGYEKIGVLAPILLIFLRIMQGLFVSGEGANVSVFLFEHFPKWRPCFLSAVSMVSNSIGVLCAILVGIVINKTSILNWRAAFVIGCLIGFVAFYLRLKIDESPEFLKAKRQKKLLSNPILTMLKVNYRNLIACACVAGATNAFSNFLKIYLNILLVNSYGFSAEKALHYVAFSNGLLIIFIPFFGWLADNFGYKRIMTIGAYSTIIAIVPTLMLIDINKEIELIFLLTIIVLLSSSISAPCYIYSINLFPIEQRTSGVVFGNNLGIACLGSYAPVVFAYLVDITHLHYAAGFYIIFVTAVLVIALKFIEKNAPKIL